MSALLHAGLPPVGVGVFGRGQSFAWLSQWKWVALHAGRADTATKAPALMAAGVEVWLYTTPERWTPAAYPAELARIVAQAKALGVAGIIANPEAGWAGSAARTVAGAFGRALAEAAEHTRVGVVSIPLWPPLEELARECKGKVWGSPENYAKASYAAGGATKLAEWWARWTRAFGELRVIPAFSAWFGSNGIVVNDAASFETYLRAQPKAQGAIGWTTNSTPAWAVAAMHAYEPAGFMPLRYVMNAIGWLLSPLGIVVLVVAALALIGGVLL